jgi:hypothetical protein
MPFLNYDEIQRVYPQGLMKENIDLLKEFNSYHCLLAPVRNNKFPLPDGLPRDYSEWTQVCGGGMLFDTTLLTATEHDDTLDLDFATYREFNDLQLFKEEELPDAAFVFAVAVHSDLFFFNLDDTSGQAYQWDAVEKQIYQKWLSFEDWLTDQISDAVDLIAADKIDPLDIKVMDD